VTSNDEENENKDEAEDVLEVENDDGYFVATETQEVVMWRALARSLRVSWC
jgi:hypothetical protein